MCATRATRAVPPLPSPLPESTAPLTSVPVVRQQAPSSSHPHPPPHTPQSAPPRSPFPFPRQRLLARDDGRSSARSSAIGGGLAMKRETPEASRWNQNELSTNGMGIVSQAMTKSAVE